jgi:hypothetical protein
MRGLKPRRLFILFLAGLSAFWLPNGVDSQEWHKSKQDLDVPAISRTSRLADYLPMPGPGKKVSIGNNNYFTYEFDKALKMGTVIMKLRVYNKSGDRETSLEVFADAGMPSMRGAHDTGPRPLKLSRAGDYLHPIDLVMRGGWEIRLTILKDGEIVFRGCHRFNV